MSYNEQIIALAGMFQAGYLVRQVAREGRVEEPAFTSSLASILKMDAATTEEVYGGVEGVRLGLSLLSTMYEPHNKQRDMEITQYVLGIAHLEKKLSKNAKLMQEISTGIDRATSQTEMFGLTHENVIASLAGIYADTISTLTPRIVVSGEQGYLSNNENANKVRALLLALMRSSVLWRQKGGARWQFLFNRKKIMKTAASLVKSI